jgi:hypothetical protein
LQDDAVRIILFCYNNPECAQRIGGKKHRKPLIAYGLTRENLIGLVNDRNLFVNVDTGPSRKGPALVYP